MKMFIKEKLFYKPGITILGIYVKESNSAYKRYLYKHAYVQNCITSKFIYLNFVSTSHGDDT